jgi:hypothetical protein
MAKYLDVQLDQLQSISNRDFSRWLGHWYGFGSKKWSDASLQVKQLQLLGKEPSQEELKVNPTLRHAWNDAAYLDLIKTGDRPTQEQLNDPNFAAAWQGVKNNVAVAKV